MRTQKQSQVQRPKQTPPSKPPLQVMRQIMDVQLRTRDKHLAGRPADIEAEWRDDGTLVLTHLVVGPQALAARVSSRLRPLARALLRDRFERRIPMREVVEVGSDLRLRGKAADYGLDRADKWVMQHILRFIPGNGMP